MKAQNKVPGLFYSVTVLYTPGDTWAQDQGEQLARKRIEKALLGGLPVKGLPELQPRCSGHKVLWMVLAILGLLYLWIRILSD